jgi:hypothetical protein
MVNWWNDIDRVKRKYSITQITRIKWDRQPSGYAENPNNWTFFENRLHSQFKVEKEIYRRLFLGYIFIYTQMKY